MFISRLYRFSLNVHSLHNKNLIPLEYVISNAVLRRKLQMLFCETYSNSVLFVKILSQSIFSGGNPDP